MRFGEVAGLRFDNDAAVGTGIHSSGAKDAAAKRLGKLAILDEFLG
jgi:hypothetical protein